MMKKTFISPATNPFKVPENYFEDVTRKIISETAGHEEEVSHIGIYSRFRNYFLVAASVAGFIILSYAAIRLLAFEKMRTQVSEVIIEDYDSLYLNEIDILTLEENAASVIPFEEMPDVSSSDIIDYLLLENIDINEIYEQL
jgi:hypothetical protein